MQLLAWLVTLTLLVLLNATVKKNAFVMLLTTNDYLMGCQVVIQSLRNTNTSVQTFVCLVTDEISMESTLSLRRMGCDVRVVAPLANPQHDTVERTWFRSTYTKLHIWNLTEFDTIVYLDSDLLVLKNIDDLFVRPFTTLAAAPDMLPPDQFQSGLLAIKPNNRTYARMLEQMMVLPSYDGGDQGFLNSFFRNWYEMPSHSRLPSTYNIVQTMAHLYPPAWKLHEPNMRVLHFSGDPHMKPWRADGRVVVESIGPYFYRWSDVAEQVHRVVNGFGGVSELQTQAEIEPSEPRKKPKKKSRKNTKAVS